MSEQHDNVVLLESHRRAPNTLWRRLRLTPGLVARTFRMLRPRNPRWRALLFALRLAAVFLRWKR
jgi:hypothetical protein